MDDRLMLMRFGILVADEVHMAVVDYFMCAGFLRFSAVYGLSGSLVRGDDRFQLLSRNIGPIQTQVERSSNVHTVFFANVNAIEVYVVGCRHVWSTTSRIAPPESRWM